MIFKSYVEYIVENTNFNVTHEVNVANSNGRIIKIGDNNNNTLNIQSIADFIIFICVFMRDHIAISHKKLLNIESKKKNKKIVCGYLKYNTNDSQ